MRIIDLFAGAGGLSEGFRQAGHVVLAGADSDPDACATYARNFPESESICGDLRRGDIRERVLTASEPTDVIVGGPPCQAFSQVRNHSRLIDDPRNSLYREFVWIVAEARPLAFVMENVPGLDQMGAREQVAGDLAPDSARLSCSFPSYAEESCGVTGRRRPHRQTAMAAFGTAALSTAGENTRSTAGTGR